ncbi:MAG TPA: prepilin-type N-terminal cleavage/methylation domain-containing protein [Candidatus Paceibacterota bacterium]|nr:prepilin-type N-terminal cleavage/methylation domain-containing protein [Candidatus Paceibacterota bacterium]
MRERRGFTIIELLISIAIVVVIAVVVIFVLSPSTYVAQSQDARRLSDLGALNNAISLYQPAGVSGTIYTSLIDFTATSSAGTNCSGVFGAMSAPYHCAASSSAQNIDGTGWIPINFTSKANPPISVLPLDPVNTSSSGDYYIYVSNDKTFEVATKLVSSKNSSLPSNDGGGSSTLYEVGSSLHSL